MKKIKFTLNINEQKVEVEAPENEKLVWVIREYEKTPLDGTNQQGNKGRLVGTKFGCGKGDCGACTVVINDKPENSCLISIQDCVGKQITTIEGIADENELKIAWMKVGMNQCAFCQAGMFMRAYGYLLQNPDPTETEMVGAMNGNLCRCGTYHKVKKAIFSYYNNNIIETKNSY